MNGDLLRCAEMAFSKRLVGMEPVVEWPRYDGPFDYMAVVNAASLPRNHSIQEHRRAWAAFRQLLSEEWNQQKAMAR